MKQYRKILAVLLCMVMCFSLLPTWAFAEEGQAEEDIVVEEEVLTEEPVEEEVVAEEEDFVIEEEADPNDGGTNRSDPDAAWFEDLKAAIADETVGEFALSGQDEFVLPDDLNIYGGFFIDNDDATLVVPAGVTLTATDYAGIGKLRIENGGKVIVNRGHAEFYDEIEIEPGGSLLIDQADAVLEADEVSSDELDRITHGNGWINLQCYTENEAEFNARLAAAEALPKNVGTIIWVRFPWTLDQNINLASNINLTIDGIWRDGSIVIPKDFTLSADSDIDARGAELRVQGSFVNNGRLFLDMAGNPNAPNKNPGKLVIDGGRYSGMGSICVPGPVDPASCIQGLDISGYDKSTQDLNGGQWTVLSDSSALFEALKAACESGTEIEFDLSNKGDFLIREDLVIPQGFRMDTHGTWIVIPSGVTVTVAKGANFEMHNLQLDAGGAVDVGENGFFNTYDEIRLNGDIYLGNNADSHFPAKGMDAAARAKVHFDGNNSRANIHYPVNNETELYDAASQAVQLERPFNGNIQVCFNWSVNEDFVVEENYGFDINGAWNDASVTIPAGKKLTVNGYLNSESGVTTVQGTLENNGWMELRKNDNPDALHPGLGRIVMDGGSYAGSGEICVRDVASVEEAAGYLGDLAESYAFKTEVREDGVYFRLPEPDWDFASLQKACAKTYSEETRLNIPNEGMFTIEKDLTVPRNLLLNKDGEAILVPKGVTLTVVGGIDCAGLVVNGSVLLRDGGYINVYGETLAGEGTIEIQRDSHMDANTAAWKDGAWIDHIQFVEGESGWSWMTVWYDMENAEDALNAVADKPALNNHIGRSLNIKFDWTLTDDLDMPNEMQMEIRGHDGGSLTIPKGVTLTMNNVLRTQGADVTVFGTLVNRDRLEVHRSWDEYSRLGKFIFEEGSTYAGEGRLWVDTLDHPEAYLPGLDLSDFKTTEEEGGTLYTNNTALFENLKAAMAAGEDYELRGGTELVLPEDLTVPDGVGLHFWGSSIVVPEGVTLTVEGFAGGSDLLVGGTVNVQGGNLNVHEFAFTGETAHMTLDDGEAFIPAQAWTEDMAQRVDLGENCWLNLNMLAESRDQLLGECRDLVQETEPPVRYWVTATFPYVIEATRATRSDDMFVGSIPENVVFEFVSSEEDNNNGSLTIGKDANFTSDGSLRFSGAGAKLTIQGTLINNDWIDLDGDAENGYGSIVFEKGAVYDGEGWICARREENPEGQLGQLTARYTFEQDPDFEGGALYRKTGEVVPSVWLRAANMSFEGQIQMIVKFTLSDEPAAYEGWKLVFSNGTEVPVTEGKLESDGRYAYYCPVPIPEFDQPITITLKNADGQETLFKVGKEETVVESYDYNIPTYIHNKWDDPDMGPLVQALDTYGKAAADRFLGGTYVLDLSKVNLDAVTATKTGGSKPAGVTVSQNVNFESDNSLNIKITLPQGKKVGDYTITKPADVVQTVEGQVVTLKVPNIAAPNLSVRHSFSISDGKDTFTIETSAMAYAKNIAGKATSSQEDVNLMKALYSYHLAAVDYFK